MLPSCAEARKALMGCHCFRKLIKRLAAEVLSHPHRFIVEEEALEERLVQVRRRRGTVTRALDRR